MHDSTDQLIDWLVDQPHVWQLLTFDTMSRLDMAHLNMAKWDHPFSSCVISQPGVWDHLELGKHLEPGFHHNCLMSGVLWNENCTPWDIGCKTCFSCSNDTISIDCHCGSTLFGGTGGMNHPMQWLPSNAGLQTAVVCHIGCWHAEQVCSCSSWPIAVKLSSPCCCNAGATLLQHAIDTLTSCFPWHPWHQHGEFIIHSNSIGLLCTPSRCCNQQHFLEGIMVIWQRRRKLQSHDTDCWQQNWCECHSTQLVWSTSCWRHSIQTVLWGNKQLPPACCCPPMQIMRHNHCRNWCSTTCIMPSRHHEGLTKNCLVAWMCLAVAWLQCRILFPVTLPKEQCCMSWMLSRHTDVFENAVHFLLGTMSSFGATQHSLVVASALWWSVTWHQAANQFRRAMHKKLSQFKPANAPFQHG